MAPVAHFPNKVSNHDTTQMFPRGQLWPPLTCLSGGLGQTHHPDRIDCSRTQGMRNNMRNQLFRQNLKMRATHPGKSSMALGCHSHGWGQSPPRGLKRAPKGHTKQRTAGPTLPCLAQTLSARPRGMTNEELPRKVVQMLENVKGI